MAQRVKVTNISRHVDQAVLEKLFSYIGGIAKLDLHPSSVNAEVQEAQIEFSEAASVRAALFLTGTEVAERALVVIEDNQMSGHIMSGGGAHAMPLANAPVVAMMARRPRTAGAAAIPANVAAIIHPSVLQFDPMKAEEISRTIYVGNIASWVGEQQLMDFFSASGPVAYVKMAGDGMQPTRFAFVEFADVQTAQGALQMNGMMLADRPLKVNHSKNAINKPQQQRSAVPSVGTGGPLVAPVAPSVPTLAAIASLPSNMDPVAAASLLNSTVQARLQAARQQGSSGLAWPVLGTVNPTVSMSAQGDEQDIAKKIRDLQAQMEAKYGHTRKGGESHRSRSRESSESRRRRRHRRDDENRSSRRHRRSPSVAERSSRRRRDDSPRSYRDGRRRSRSTQRSPSGRRSSRRHNDDEYWRDRGSGRAASPLRERR